MAISIKVKETTRQAFQMALDKFGHGAEVECKEFNEWAADGNISDTESRKISYLMPRVKHGVMKLSMDHLKDYKEPKKESNGKAKAKQNKADNGPSMASKEAEVTLTKEAIVKEVDIDEYDSSYIPEKSSLYVGFGHHKFIKKIVESNKFFPVYISGLSGNGKTFMVEQVCAQLDRELVRVQVSIETDEDSLIGGFRLINGETVFHKGPVIQAMERGAILLIDEIDRGSGAKLLALQGVLEGKPIMIKRTGEIVKPKEGFNIIATANSKGRGSDDGRFVSQIQDDALLERFNITVEQDYPNLTTERKILSIFADDLAVFEKENFIEALVKWGQATRQTYIDGGISDMVTTRRLTHILSTADIIGATSFKGLQQAVEYSIARFDEDTKLAMLDLFNKVYAGEQTDDDFNNDNLQ